MRLPVLILMALLATAATAPAQSFSENIEALLEEMEEKKKEMIPEVLKLDEDTADTFWDLYEEFQWAVEKENEKYTELFWEYLDTSKELNDERARTMVRTYLELEEESIRLRKSYMDKFAEILTPLQLVHLFQIENKAEALVKHRAATYIPFLE